MSKVLQRRTALLALFASLVFCTAALAQMPINPWKKAAPFPYPDEELYGVALNGKMYVIGRQSTRAAIELVTTSRVTSPKCTAPPSAS